jgi:hypothetical protein
LDILKAREESELVMSKNATFEFPPLGLGFLTLTHADPAPATSEADTTAVNSELLRKVVVNGVPFQFATELEIKPVPFTVNENPEPPGATVSGTSG